MPFRKPPGPTAQSDEGPEQIRAHLAAALASHSFHRGVHKRRQFLAYVVDRALERDTPALEENAIGAALFGIEPSCPYSETVPMLARRTRASLKRYYEKEGRDTTIRIEIPLRGYVPQFGKPLPVGLRTAVWTAMIALALLASVLLVWEAARAIQPKPLFLAVAVTPCTNLGGLPTLDADAKSMTQALTTSLQRYKRLKVVSPEWVPGLDGAFPNYPIIADQLSVDALVRCAVYPLDKGYGIVAQLVDGHSSLRLWWDMYQTDGGLVELIADDAALAVARQARVAEDR